MSDSEWLQSLKAGDEAIVYVGISTSPYLATVDRTTATQIITGPHRFHRKNGNEVGASVYSRTHIMQPTPERVEKARRAAALSKLRRIVDTNTTHIPTQAIVAAMELLDVPKD